MTAVPDPSPADPADLDHDPAAWRALGEHVLERVVEHLSGLAEAPIRGVHPEDDTEALCRELAADPAPEQGQPMDEVLAPLFDGWLQRSFGTALPGYVAFVPGGGLYEAALADFIACATNRYTGVWAAAPALVQLEANVLRWLTDWMGYPDQARGLLTTGGSMANFSAIVCARETKLGERLRDGVAYVSDQVHHCVTKSARLAGILPDRLRRVPSGDDFALDVDALRAAIAADRAAGLVPFLVVSSAGTTNTGAVDPLDALSDLCAEEGLWHHCDGAYGACFQLVPALRPTLSGLSRTDSLTLDPHKGFFLPYGTGALLVRDGEALRRAHAEHAGYLPDPNDAFYDPSRYGPELSRDNRGLRLWLPLKVFGVARFRAALAEKHALTVRTAEAFAALPGLVLDTPPRLSLFAFHVTWAGASQDDQDGATAELLERVTRRGRVMMTGCRTKDRFLGRVCVLSFRTRAEQIEQLVEDTREELAALLAERGVSAG